MLVSFIGVIACLIVSVSVVATESVGFETESVAVAKVVVSAILSSGNLNFKFSEVCVHLPSIHACPSAKTSIVFNFGFVIFTRWVNLAVPVKKYSSISKTSLYTFLYLPSLALPTNW